jgi:hypothetical protein
MESTPRLYDTLVHVLSQHENWVDRRHLKTLAWMMVGLIQASVVSLTAWARPLCTAVRCMRRALCAALIAGYRTNGSRSISCMGP